MFVAAELKWAQNYLLASLPADEFSANQNQVRICFLKARRCSLRIRQMDYAYFPTTAIIDAVYYGKQRDRRNQCYPATTGNQ